MLRDPLIDTNLPAILLAEDDPDQSEMLSDILRSEGFCVDTAFSGDTAIHKLSTHTYDVVILDVRMPGINGAEVLRLYRKSERGAKTPVIIVSAFATEDQMRQYRLIGATRSFSKPYDVQELIENIRELTATGKESK